MLSRVRAPIVFANFANHRILGLFGYLYTPTKVVMRLRSSLFWPLAVIATACGTIMHGTSQSIGVSSSPTGAQVSVDNMPVGNTPVIANLSRSGDHIVHVSLAGYAPADLTVTKSVSGWVWGNIVFGGIIGLAVDAITGGLYKLTPDQLTTTLAKTATDVSPAKDGIYIVLVQKVDPAWTKVGQLIPMGHAVVGLR
jgi:hypothetical protein